MDIASITGPTSTKKTSDFVSFSTTDSISDNFLVDMMSQSLDEYEQKKVALTTSVKESDPSDPLDVLQLQGQVDEIKKFENLSSTLVGKCKAAFEKLVYNNQ